MRACKDWKDFEVLDTSCGDKLERWGTYTTVRPDPQVIWQTPKQNRFWEKATAVYTRSKSGGGAWSVNNLPQSFNIAYKDLKFLIRPTSFKHMGLFPEQAVNWDAMRTLIENAGREVSVLNLFAYTGGASVACAKSGALVTHVDASKGIVSWAKENCTLNDISNVRFIVDDCLKFVEKEIRRGKHYDAVIMDPPSYGRGPNGEIWKLEDEIYGLVDKCMGVLSDKPLFFLLNSYTTGLSSGCMTYLLSHAMTPKFGGTVEGDEIGLPVRDTGLVLPCGCSVMWKAK